MNNEATRELLENIEKIHTTQMGYDRIKRNLSLICSDDEVITFCKKKILDKKSIIARCGKNWYIHNEKIILTVNAYSFTIITAHKE